MDVKSALFNEILSELVYVKQPKGFENSKFHNHVYRLKKALYELKRASKASYEGLTTQLLEKNFEKKGVGRTLFICRSKDELLVAQIYVDDIVFGANASNLALSFAEKMKIEFQMSMTSELTFSLGLQIRQLKDGIFLFQSKYARQLVKKFSLESTKHSRTPMSTTNKLSKDAFGKNVEQKLYRSMIRNLLYLIVICPDISFSVRACVRYQENPKELHLIFIKRIMRYINENPDYILLLLVISTLIGLEMLRIERTHLVLVFLFVIIL